MVEVDVIEEEIVVEVEVKIIIEEAVEVDLIVIIDEEIEVEVTAEVKEEEVVKVEVEAITIDIMIDPGQDQIKDFIDQGLETGIAIDAEVIVKIAEVSIKEGESREAQEQEIIMQVLLVVAITILKFNII